MKRNSDIKSVHGVEQSADMQICEEEDVTIVSKPAIIEQLQLAVFFYKSRALKNLKLTGSTRLR